MADYAMTANEHTVLRASDGAFIPDDPANRDFQEYLTWLSQGNKPDPYAAPPAPPPEPTMADLIRQLNELKAKIGG